MRRLLPDANGDRVVSDGYYDERGGPDEGATTRSTDRGAGRRGRWITVFHLDWDALTAKPEPLCLHGSSWASQDAYPHPFFSPDGKSVWFTSDREGKRAIYEVDAT